MMRPLPPTKEEKKAKRRELLRLRREGKVPVFDPAKKERPRKGPPRLD
jgi:hypothetical protein